MIHKIISAPFIGLIKFYQLAISPYLGSNCRFSPTCSAYALQAYKTHNPITATRLTIFRLMKCHPWGKSGYDPVPAQKGKKEC